MRPAFCATCYVIQVASRSEKEAGMKAFVLGCVAAMVMAIAAMVILNRVQEPVAQAFATTGVRL